MPDNVENLLLEHLKRFQAGQDRIERKLDEHTQRFSRMESVLARIGRENADFYSEQVDDRRSLDALRDRIERIERRLELNG
jgi:septation ring formation regulator EzrA